MTRPKLSAAMEDYLKAIYHLREEGAEVTTVSLAAHLGVAPPSVTSMVKRLHELGLVLHSPYRGVDLTPAGYTVAVEIVRHHRLIELYLTEFLDVPWDKVHDEAERLEHVLSEDLESRMAEKLGQPSFDPHGQPIPSCEGTVSEPPTLALWDAVPGSRMVVARLGPPRVGRPRDPGLLAHLPALGLMPGAVVEVVEVAPYNGTLTIRVNDTAHVIGSDLAKTIRVRAAAQESTAGEGAR